MRYKLRLLLCTLVSIMFIYVVLFSCVQLVAFNRPFYYKEQTGIIMHEKTQLEQADIHGAMNTLLDYLEGKKDNISYVCNVNGEMREAFTQDEYIHMIDVKKLYENAKFVCILFVAYIIVLLAVLLLDKRKHLGYLLSYAYSRVFVVFLFLIGGLAVYAYCDFTTFWESFHKVFFSNDLWLLNIYTSVMINLLPEPVFYKIVFYIVGLFIAITLGVFILSVIVQKRKVKAYGKGNLSV